MVRSTKKCIPGLFCIENMTLFLSFVLLVTVTYLYYTTIVKATQQVNTTKPVTILAPPVQILPAALATTSSHNERPLQSEYAPPLKYENDYGQRGVPINIKTRGYEANYSQLGILTRENGHGDLILPLMGRKSMSARDKYQYYTMTNSAGNINTKLPVSVKGRSCTSDLGCDEISNGDVAYVEGYKDTFRATIYENALYSYIPW